MGQHWFNVMEMGIIIFHPLYISDGDLPTGIIEIIQLVFQRNR